MRRACAARRRRRCSRAAPARRATESAVQSRPTPRATAPTTTAPPSTGAADRADQPDHGAAPTDRTPGTDDGAAGDPTSRRPRRRLAVPRARHGRPRRPALRRRLATTPRPRRIDGTVTLHRRSRPGSSHRPRRRRSSIVERSRRRRRRPVRARDIELLITPGDTVEPVAPVAIAVSTTTTARRRRRLRRSARLVPADGGSYVLNEPDGARSWLPSNDHPADKATWRFEITVPDRPDGRRQRHLVEQRPDAATTWVWDQPRPMATYLLQVLTGDYEVLDGGTAGTLPMTNVALRATSSGCSPTST